MSRLANVLAALGVLTVVAVSAGARADPDADLEAVSRTGAEITAAFARGGVPAIMAYHHPDVVKALSWDKVLYGRTAVESDLRAAFRASRLEFTDHRVESLVVRGDAAVEMTAFTILVTPRAGGAPFPFRGRAMVVYVRYAPSPTGWASIREVVQPATN